jgi:hypothetical protein
MGGDMLEEWLIGTGGAKSVVGHFLQADGVHA